MTMIEQPRTAPPSASRPGAVLSPEKVIANRNDKRVTTLMRGYDFSDIVGEEFCNESPALRDLDYIGE